MFTHPMWLWGLGGIVIPLAIHLLSRKEGKVIRIGSLRHLSESTTQQFKSIRLNEVLLLLLRCALIILFVLLMAEPKVLSVANEKWVLVEPGLSKNPQAMALADSLQEKGYERRMFTDGFPEAASPRSSASSVGPLLHQLTQQPIADAVVISSSTFTQFAGEQIARPAFVKWVTIDPTPHAFIAHARRVSTDTVAVVNGLTDATQTSFTTSSLVVPPAQRKLFPPDSVTIQPRDTVRISLAADDGFAYEKKIMKAAIATLENMGKVVLVVTEKVDTTSHWLFWLSQRELPATGQRILSYRFASSPTLLYPVARDHWALSRRLTHELVVQDHFVLELGQLLLQDFPAVADLRVMPEKMMWANADDTSASLKKPAAINGWLVMAFCMVLLAERLISFRKKL